MPPKAKKSAAATAAAPAISSPTQDDISMTDAPATSSPAPAPEPEVEWFSEQQRIRILPGSSDFAASFEFTDEDHTLGNALRYIIMKNPEVEFCGYSIPHPSEPKMNLRIQTYGQNHGDTTVIQVLEKGFDDLMALCDVVTDKFTDAKRDFEVNGPEIRQRLADEEVYDGDDL